MYCPSCHDARLSLVEQAQLARVARMAISGRVKQTEEAPTGHKWCATCARFLPHRTFGTRKEAKDGLTSNCKPCKSLDAYSRRLMRTFEMTLEQYETLLAAQGGGCAICEATPRSKRLAVDHDHQTGLIRGLLCERCNHQVLGAAKEDVNVLKRAIRYLEHPPASQLGLWYNDRTGSVLPPSGTGQ